MQYGHGGLPEPVLVTETHLCDMESENNLCLSLSQNLIVHRKKSSTSSYLAKAKNKIFGGSIGNFFGRKKAKMGESYSEDTNSKDNLMAAEECNYEGNENGNDCDGRKQAKCRNIASGNQSGTIATSDSMAQTYRKILCDPKNTIFNGNGAVIIYDSDYDEHEESEHNNNDGTGNRKGTFEDIEKGHVWHRTP